MRKKAIISLLIIVLLIIGTLIFFINRSRSSKASSSPVKSNVDKKKNASTNSETGDINIYSVIKNAIKTNPNVTIGDVEIGKDWLAKPEKEIFIAIDTEKTYVEEYKDTETAEKDFPISTEGGPFDSFIANHKGKVIIKYNGENKKVIQLFDKLLD